MQKYFDRLLELMLYVPVNSYGHVGTLDFYPEEGYHPNNALKINKIKKKGLHVYDGWFDLNHL